MKNTNKIMEQHSIPIKTVSKILNISQPTLRYYEKEKLISASRDQESNYRLYSFLSLIELTDVILFRNLGMPIKEIRHLLNSPINNSLDVIDQVIDDTYKQIDIKLKTLKQLSLFERKVREYLSLSTDKNLHSIVGNPHFSKFYRFSFDSEKSMGAYLENPYSFPYGFFLNDPTAESEYIDCILETPATASAAKHYDLHREDIVWENSSRKARYLECILITEYGITEENNLQQHLEYMKEHSMEPGHVLGHYLLYDYSPEDKKRYDYYRIWIEIIN